MAGNAYGGAWHDGIGEPRRVGVRAAERMDDLVNHRSYSGRSLPARVVDPCLARHILEHPRIVRIIGPNRVRKPPVSTARCACTAILLSNPARPISVGRELDMNLSVGRSIGSGGGRERAESQLPIAWKCGVYQLDRTDGFANQFGRGSRCQPNNRRRRTEACKKSVRKVAVRPLPGVLLEVGSHGIPPHAVRHIAERRADAAMPKPLMQNARGRRNLSTILRHRRFLFTDSLLLLWK